MQRLKNLKQNLERIAQLENEAQGEAKRFYEILTQVGKEIEQLGEKAHFYANENLKETLESLNEVLEELIETPYENLRLKMIFETLDGIMMDLDDCVEDLNEQIGSNAFSYIEQWDVAFFFEHM